MEIGGNGLLELLLLLKAHLLQVDGLADVGPSALTSEIGPGIELVALQPIQEVIIDKCLVAYDELRDAVVDADPEVSQIIRQQALNHVIVQAIVLG